MIVFKLQSTKEEVLSRLFSELETGAIKLGWTGLSGSGLKPEDLFTQKYKFNDYVLEGGVSYLLQLEDHGTEVWFKLELMGATKRDKAVEPLVSHYLRDAGLKFEIVKNE